MNYKTMSAALAGWLALASSAMAEEVRTGLAVHDINIVNQRRSVEQSTSIVGQYIFDQPKWLEWTHARPYVYGSLNLDEKTNHAGAGLNWQQKVIGNAFIEFETGLSVHDGTSRIREDFSGVTSQEEFTVVANRIFERRNKELEFGSTVLFRFETAIGYDFNETWGADIFYEHLSHNNIFDEDNNDGLDSLGLRVSRKF